MIYLLAVGAALIGTVSGYGVKILTKKGIHRKDYFFYMCVAAVPLSAVLMLVEEFRFSWHWLPFVLLIVAMIVRYVRQRTVITTTRTFNPFEIQTYLCLPLLITYGINCAIGEEIFSWWSLLAIVIILCGVFLLTRVKFSRTIFRPDVIIRILCEVALCFLAHYILQYWSNAFYILLLNFLLTFMFIPTYSPYYHYQHRKIFWSTFAVQAFGTAQCYIQNLLATQSATLYALVSPISLVFTLFVAMCFNKSTYFRKPNWIDIVSVFIVAGGVVLLALL